MNTLRAGLIGAHIQATRLPKALEIMCAASGMVLDFTLIDTGDDPEFDFGACVDDLRERGWTGVTVTHPWKAHAAAYAGDAMKAEVAHLGASNTLVFGDGLTGWNTDYTGFLAAWEAEYGGGPSVVAMAGAGGVARAIGPALASLKATEIRIWDVDEGKAAELAAEIGPCARAVTLDEAEAAARGADGLVNATALGMGGDGRSAFPPDWIGGQAWAFDAVYTPTDTPFLQNAARAGLATISGFDLFRQMALRSFEAYTGHTPDEGAIMPLLAALRPK